MLNRKALSARVRRAVERCQRYTKRPFLEYKTDKAEELLKGDFELSKKQREDLDGAVKAAWKRWRAYEIGAPFGVE